MLVIFVCLRYFLIRSACAGIIFFLPETLQQHVYVFIYESEICACLSLVQRENMLNGYD